MNFSDLGKTSVALSVNSTVTLENLEGSLVAPGVVPGVNGKPVVFAIFGSPSDELDGVTSKFGSGGVLIDSALVGQEVFVDGESSGDSSVGVDVLLDLVNLAGNSESVGGGGVVLVSSVVNGRVSLAG